MQSTKHIAGSALALLLSVGCGNSNDAGPGRSTATTSDITTYQQLAVKVQDGARTYRTTMMAPGTATSAECRRVHDQYDAEVRPWVSRMVQMSGAMDRYMNDHGGGYMADYACVSATMMYELDHHGSVACTRANLGADQVEAGRHVDAMLSYGGHMWDRCNEMMRGVDTGSWGWTPMMGMCADWDGRCNAMMYNDCHGDMMDRMHGNCCDHAERR